MFSRIIFLFILVKLSGALEVVCHFETLTFWGYTCGVVNQNVPTESNITFSIDDIDKGKTKNDVNCVEFANSSIDFVPKEIFTNFPSVDRLIFLRTNFRLWKKEFLKSGSDLIAFVNVENAIEDLEDDSFGFAPDLLVLTLYNNRIKEISTFAFRGLAQLSILQLSGNRLTYLDENIFDDLDNLSMLDLFDNSLSMLPLGIFDENKKLDTLRLDGNKFVVVAPGVFEPTSSLKSLNLTNNLIFSIDASVLPKNLQKIYVGKFNLSFAGLVF
jgi:Leucine rich repeat